jgi:hypothetical protein
MNEVQDTAKARPPVPETKRALLISAAFEQPTPTPHKFVGTKACVLPGPGGGRAWEFKFQCCVTGFERRFGVVDRVVDAPVDMSPYDNGGN